MPTSPPNRSDPSDGTPAPRAVKDIWSRTASTYRVRAVALLALNILLFAGVGSFAYWLRSGVRFAPAHPGYADELEQTFLSVPVLRDRETSISLGSLLLEPISVQAVPMQIPILGLLMATLIAIPILVSILYRFWASLPFIAIVAFLAVMPWLAITLVISCALASLQPFRTRFRFVSALLGLVPAVVYFMFAWWGTADIVVGRIDPIDRIKFVAPWVLAVVASAVVFALVLATARLVNYRPGSIAPLLAVLLVLPVALFEVHVGRDELYYRLFVALNRAHFADVDASMELDRAVMEMWMRHPPPRGNIEAIRATVETRWLFELMSDLEPVLDPVRSTLARHQAELVERCDWFHRYFPTSRYLANVLFLKARALDTRVDPGEFRQTKWIRFYDEFPSPASRSTWRIIVENWPHTDVGAVAQWKLAQLDARDGDVQRARSRLVGLLSWFDNSAGNSNPLKQGEVAVTAIWSRGEPQLNLGISRERVRLETRRLLDLITENRDPIYGDDPLCGLRGRGQEFTYGLLDLDPRHAKYVENLVRLNERFPNSQLADNIELEIAKAARSMSMRIERLRACLDRYPQGDASAEAMFRLGAALIEDGESGAGEQIFAELIREHGTSVWAREAQAFTPWPPQLQLSEAAGQ